MDEDPDDTVMTEETADDAAVAPPPPPPSKKSTAVDGRGMWRSWTRVFAEPESACLDLLDNCFDAALAPGFEGRVIMKGFDGNSLLIQNNSRTPIKKLEDALTVYKSSKNNSTAVAASANNGKEAIGENGVGLKQGCAALSDCAVVFTRNRRTVEIGVVAKALQSSESVYLPSFSFTLEQIWNTSIELPIHQWLSNNSDILGCLMEASGIATLADVKLTLAQLVQRMFTSEWQNEDHVFLLVLCNLKKRTKLHHDLVDSVNPVDEFLRNVKTMLPEYYINLPSFNFVIEQERINFSFWQSRLIELTRFEVYIPFEESFDTLDEKDWDQPGPNKYKLNIYCGFDAKRVYSDGRRTSPCHLYIYSRDAGRLIERERDARYLLGLSASGVDYTQGLTVIINDIDGKLPLTPTKDGIAWSEQPSGGVHRKNLFAWSGALAHFFWTHHRNSFAGNKSRAKTSNNVKEMMKKAIASFAEEELAASSVTATNNLENAKVSTFLGIKWKRIKTTYDTWNIRRDTDPKFSKFSTSRGPDTLFSFKDRVKRVEERSAPKRKAIPVLATADGSSEPVAFLATSYESSNGGPWPEVARDDIKRVAIGMLEYLRGVDDEKLFELPVVEMHPQLKDSYLQVVANPMDFRTIEERMGAYTSTTELQQDLMLVFQNCIRFNGESSPFGQIAKKMLNLLDDSFQSVLLGKRCRKKVNYADIQRRYDEEQFNQRTKPASARGASSNVQLRRQLKAEQAKVKDLQKQVAARDRRIEELEARCLGPQEQPFSISQQHQESETTVFIKTEGCQACGHDNDYHLMILCDECDSEYHIHCLDPPLDSVPSGSWYCAMCSAMDLPLSEEEEDDDDRKMPATVLSMPDGHSFFE